MFPERALQAESEEFYYRFQDEIFSPVCQIYLERKYSPEQFAKEIERLEGLELSYLGQTNKLYIDEENYCSTSYVALANWRDRFEYALALENLHTVIYVYMQNMDKKDLYMDKAFLPAYFRENNEESFTFDYIDAEHRSFYGFKIGEKYIECGDLVDEQCHVWWQGEP